ncbi:MAG: amidohydrolase family protein [Candidatus Omnitrophota bacterium]
MAQSKGKNTFKMLCDAHVHYIPEELSVHTAFYKGVWTDKEKLYAFINEHGIEHALLVYPSTDAHLKLGSLSNICNLYHSALEKVIKENRKVIAAGLIDFDNIADIKHQVAVLKNNSFSALSLSSSHNGKFIIDQLIPLFEAAQDYSMPVFVHPQTINPIGFERVKDPLLMPVLEYSFDISMFLGLLMMEGVFDKYKIKFIFSSLAGVVPFLKDRFDRVYTMLRGRKIVKDLGKLPTEILRNVYVDTSGSSIANIKLAIDLFGEDKILWGSDYPVNSHIKTNLSVLDELGSEVKEKITTKNFFSIFNL